MRRLILGMILLLMTGTLYGQVTASAGTLTTTSNSVIDHNGNLIIFDVSYAYPPNSVNPATGVRFPPVIKTHVTVITNPSGGIRKTSFDYDGAFQVAGVGGQAVYATVIPVSTPVSISSSSVRPGVAIGGVALPPILPIPVTVNRRLVALNVVAGTLPASLPSIDTMSGEVKIAAAGNGGPDTIALIESPFQPPIAIAGTTTSSPSTASHSVRLFTFNGGSFTKINDTPISVP